MLFTVEGIDEMSKFENPLYMPNIAYPIIVKPGVNVTCVRLEEVPNASVPIIYFR